MDWIIFILGFIFGGVVFVAVPNYRHRIMVADRDRWRRKAVWLACKLHRFGDGVERFPEVPVGSRREHDNYRAWLKAADEATKEADDATT